MEACERSCEALGGLIAVFQRRVDDLCVRFHQLTAGKCEPPVTDVFAYGDTAQYTEYLLEIVGRASRLTCDLRHIKFVGDVRLDVVDSFLNSRC